MATGGGTSFDIDLAVKGAGGIEAAAASLDSLKSKLEAAGNATKAAAEAMTAGEQAYRQAEAGADRAAKALERIGLQADAQRGKLQAAMDAGDGAGAERAAEKLRALVDRQAEAAGKAAAAKTALDAEAASLDALRAAAEAAAAGETKLAQETDVATKAADKLAKLRAAGEGSGKVNEMAEAMGKLGGPVGVAGQKALGMVEGVKKLQGSLGSVGGPMAAVAIGVVSITAAFVGGVGAITVWAAKLSLGSARLKALGDSFDKNVKGLFSGLKVDKLNDELGYLSNLFDKNSASGKAIKVVFESMFQPIIDKVVELGPKLERLFIQMQILALKGLIAIKPYGSKIALIGQSLAVAAAVVVGAGAVIAAAFVGLVVVSAIVTTAIQVAIGKVVQFVRLLVSEPGAALEILRGHFLGLVGFLDGLGAKFVGIGSAIVDGMIAGIVGGAGALLASVGTLADDTVKAAKKALGIASPSRVMAAQVGEPMGEGVAVGLERAGGSVSSALETITSPGDAAAGAASSTSTSTASTSVGGHTYYLTITGGGSAQENADAFVAVLERLGAQAGGAPA